MRGWSGRCWPVAVVVMVCAGSVLAAVPKALLDVAAPRAEQRLKPSWGSDQQVSVSRSQNPPGLVMTVRTGTAQYPGVDLKPEGDTKWDLSAYDHVEARVVNTGSKAASFSLRVDNTVPGVSEPSNSEQITIEPGQAGTISVIFGRSYGHQPGYALKPNAVTGIVMFAMKADVPQSFRIERIEAAGSGPSSVAAPQGSAPQGAPAPAGAKAAGRVLLGGSTGSTSGGVRIVLPEGDNNKAAAIKPGSGHWDMRDATEIRVVVKNDGTAAITPRVQVTSDDNGTTDTIPAGRAIGPGEECEIVVPLAAPAGSGTRFRSDSVTSVRIMADRTGAGAATLLVRSIVATMP